MTDITLEGLLARTVSSAGECLLWNGQINDKGYGVFRYRGKRLYAHRMAYTMASGQIPEGAFVIHRCDQPACINPAHLLLGDHASNSLDMVAKGRHWQQAKSAAA